MKNIPLNMLPEIVVVWRGKKCCPRKKKSFRYLFSFVSFQIASQWTGWSFLTSQPFPCPLHSNICFVHSSRFRPFSVRTRDCRPNFEGIYNPLIVWRHPVLSTFLVSSFTSFFGRKLRCINARVYIRPRNNPENNSCFVTDRIKIWY